MRWLNVCLRSSHAVSTSHGLIMQEPLVKWWAFIIKMIDFYNSLLYFHCDTYIILRCFHYHAPNQVYYSQVTAPSRETQSVSSCRTWSACFQVLVCLLMLLSRCSCATGGSHAHHKLSKSWGYAWHGHISYRCASQFLQQRLQLHAVKQCGRGSQAS